MLKVACCVSVLCLSGFASAGETHDAPPPPPRFSFDAPQRARIDAAAAKLVEPNIASVKVPVYGGLTGWLVASAPFLPDTEQLYADREQRLVAATFRTVPPPRIAVDVFRRLVEQLPLSLALRKHEFSLTVVGDPGCRSWTPGAGQIYITDTYLTALLGSDDGGADRLAFVLAHELGHIDLSHTRQAYRLIEIEEQLGARLDRVELERLRTRLQTAASLSGDAVRLLFTAKQEFDADTFAVHLCRNAGFDLEAALDALRGWSTVERPGRGESPGPWHAVAPIFPDPLVRLKRLRNELDGTIAGEEFGLYRFDPVRREWNKVTAAAPAGEPPPLVFLHGMDSQLPVFQSMIDALRERRELADRPVYGLHYPGDASLACSGLFLEAELRRAGLDCRGADFIAHSAGGLVFRYYAEIRRGAFRRAVFLGTPQHGSDLAKLRPLLEVRQFFGDLNLGYSEAAARTIADGEEQLSEDLQPGSLFFTYINRVECDRRNYTICRGRALGGFRSLLLQKVVGVVRSKLADKLSREVELRDLQPRLEEAIDRLKLPAEVLDGDLVVSLDSAALKGVGATVTVEARHGELTRSPEAIQTVARALSR